MRIIECYLTKENKSIRERLDRQLNEVRKCKCSEYLIDKDVGVPVVPTQLEEDAAVLGVWQKYNNGFANKMFKKIGYSGKGLGK